MAINTADLSRAQRGFLLRYLEATAALRNEGFDAERATRMAVEVAEREHPLDPLEMAGLCLVVQVHNYDTANA